GEKKLLSEKKHKYAIVYLNLSKFRRYNIIYGWNAGERLLDTFVKILQANVNEEIEICARTRGDRFVLLLTYKTEEAFFERLKRIKVDVEAAIRQESGDYMQLQLGVYFIPSNEVDLRVGVDYASQALEFVDSNVGSNIKIYDDSIQDLLKERHDRETLLESVNINKDFVAFYQPKVDIRDGNIVGAEALVRFKDPTDNGKIKAPYYFVPYYEQTGRITELDFFVFETVCKLLRRRMDEGLSVVPISCNFSRMHFMKNGFVDRFEAVLDKYKVSKNLIEVEITETLIMEEIDHEMVKESFDELKRRGIHLSIDDFGAGYSSLGVFEQIPASVVKMDRSFFLNKDNPDRQVKIMRGIVTLSEELDAQVVCEGVETQKDVNLMEEIGAFVAQGYFYSRPIPEEEFEEKLNIGYMI
ncbi:MAG: EAL domain-containing protein, partial [Agathobacter sp.]|nr:EAL domain-containing protein [Agathobacter sp.]